ncbi:MAG: RluA family pseudouridine synthase [Natronincolaceae bacterium]|jgi:23S rRNA pseudouridine1911/1915/1917 synthase|nr:RluA family pseudouridine synthase [Clostridiales bacterium]
MTDNLIQKGRNFLGKDILIVTGEESNNRLDTYLVKQYEKLSRSYIQKLIKGNHVKVNNEPQKPNYIIKSGDEIGINLPEIEELSIKPENIHIDVVYEDGDIVVVNKQQGIIVHPAQGNLSGTLVNGLLYRYGSELSDINGIMRPGIVHRIDKDTSGLLVIAKNNDSHKILAGQFKQHTVNRKYHAIVSGIIKETNATIDAPIGRDPADRLKRRVIGGGRHAVTHFRVLDRFKDHTYIEATLETGRTHQIRVHFSYIGRPILGDPVYGYKNPKFRLKGQVLHAKTLGFVHPGTGEYVEFTSSLPGYFNKLLKVLRSNCPREQ